MAIYFHGSFGLNRSYMAGILNSALKNPKLTDDELAQPFKYKAPFSAKYRTWLHKTGITELRLPVQLTPLGEVVWKNDPALERDVTLWLMHHELTQTPDRAEAWHFFFHEFLLANGEFTREQLIMGIMNKFRAHSEKHFGPESTMNPVIARKLIECYTEDFALGRLNFIQVAHEDKYIYDPKGSKSLGPWQSAPDLEKAYSSIK